MNLSLPILGLLVALPLVGGVLLLRLDQADRARRAAIVLTALVFVGALALMAGYYRYTDGSFLTGALSFSLIGAPRPLLGIDALSAPLLPFVALVALVLAIGAPRREATPRALAALLLNEGLTLALFMCIDLGVLAVLFGGTLLPAYWLTMHGAPPEARPRLRRTFQLFGTLSMLPVLAAAVLLAWCRSTPTPLHLIGLTPPGRSGYELAAALLLGLGVIVRSAIVPLASSLPERVEGGPLLGTLPLCVTQPGAYLLVRVLLPSFPHVGPQALTGLLALGLLTALGAALLGLVQRSLRGLGGWLAVSQSSLLLIGLCAGDSEGIAGALVQWIAIGLGLTGLLLTAAALEARTGSSALAAGGVAQRAPRLAATFLLFGLGCLGFPGSLGFVAEDLLVHGLLETYPLVACGGVVVTALNGIAVLRAYARVFLGPLRTPLPPGAIDLRRGERTAALLLLLPLVLGGLFPAAPVARISRYAAALAREEARRAGLLSLHP